ncbi:unnamed protein product [Anisakis simplex]|uniref:Autophagy_act_C domain-containing protein n=1 Tax=Anisakis simplex TaxID=6269 RepID=A0A0M3K782_ANISI|nr:unnamed protein product [Anisakis simplex]
MDDDWAPLILKDDYLFSAVACASGLASDLSPISSGYRTADDNSDNNTTTNNDTNIDAHDDGHALSFMLSPSNNTNCGALQTNGINTIPPMHQNLSEFPFHFTPIDDHSNTQRDTITTSTNATEDHFNPANQQNFITTNHSHHHAHLHTAHHNHVGLIKAEPREEQCLSGAFIQFLHDLIGFFVVGVYVRYDVLR